LLRGEKPAWREDLHLEHSPYFHALTNGRDKYIWLPGTGQEQLFDLTLDANECHDLARDPDAETRLAPWRAKLITRLTGRPEGFTDGQRLIPGRPYKAALPHVAGKPRVPAMA
jgi:arylsulfatase